MAANIMSIKKTKSICYMRLQFLYFLLSKYLTKLTKQTNYVELMAACCGEVSHHYYINRSNTVRQATILKLCLNKQYFNVHNKKITIGGIVGPLFMFIEDICPASWLT